MKAILLAAGLGARLRPLTNKIPKCLVPIKGKPLLEIWLDRLSESGIGPFLINVHHLKEQVIDFVTESRYRSSVEVVEESTLLGTAGTLFSNRGFFEDADGMLIHADNYCLADFKEFMQAHYNRIEGCLMTMMTFETDYPQSCGVVEVDSQGVVIGFHEKVSNPPTTIANAAVYIFSREMLASFPEASDLSTQVLPKYVGKIQTYHTAETLIDIGTAETYQQACLLASSVESKGNFTNREG
jgi:mannose-1-phosphate guanylyltransferase|tara:strand:- start:780 stop:1502 length:723 start_codon:yes stop_codon:yes gene_type:complete